MRIVMQVLCILPASIAKDKNVTHVWQQLFRAKIYENTGCQACITITLFQNSF
jgi:hypothetical protein